MDAKMVIRRFAGRRRYLRGGYRVLVRSTDESSAIGGPIVEASVTALRSGRRFRALMFEERLFLLDELIVAGQYLDEMRRLRDRIEARASEGRIYLVDGVANVCLVTFFVSTVLLSIIR